MVRLVTWNMEGATHSQESKWTTGVSQLVAPSKIDADVICLQEAGPLPASSNIYVPPPPMPTWMPGHAPPAGMAWSFHTWVAAKVTCYILWLQTDPGANRVNIAVLTTVMPTNFWYVAPGLAGGRAALGVRRGLGDYFSLHAFSGGGADAPGLITNIQAAVGAGNAFEAAGDYNLEPPWVPPHGNLCPPDKATRWKSGKKLDYLVHSAAAQTGTVLDNLVLSDHYPVVYDV